jgi:hypothetical protein
MIMSVELACGIVLETRNGLYMGDRLEYYYRVPSFENAACNVHVETP